MDFLIMCVYVQILDGLLKDLEITDLKRYTSATVFILLKQFTSATVSTRQFKRYTSATAFILLKQFTSATVSTRWFKRDSSATALKALKTSNVSTNTHENTIDSDSTFQIFTELSSPQLARNRPSGENAQHVTALLRPGN
jgi:hypothetical protein